LTGLTTFSEAVKDMKQLLTERREISCQLKRIDVDVHAGKGHQEGIYIGVYFTSKAIEKQVGWIPKDMKCANSSDNVAELNASVINYSERYISRPFTIEGYIHKSLLS
jgi:hypothetical protein